MQKFTMGNNNNQGQFPRMSSKLMHLVLREVKTRLKGDKKWCPNETLEQIILNKYTVIELGKKGKYLSKQNQ